MTQPLPAGELPGIQHAYAALEHLEEALEEQGPALGELMARTLRELAQLRDRLIAQRRSGVGGEWNARRLDRVNSILSLATSATYPIVGVRRQRIEATRNHLRSFLEEQERPLAGMAEADGNRTHHPR